MYAPQQWLGNSSTFKPQGWVTNWSTEHDSRTSLKTFYSQLSSREKIRLETVSKSTLDRFSQIENEAVLGYTSQASLVDCQWLSSDLVDNFSETGLDWISLLTKDWPLEIHNHTVRGVTVAKQGLCRSPLSTDALVQLTNDPNYYQVALSNTRCWLYTCILALANLGKTRFVVCYKGDLRQEHYAAFLTNRLDWSPCNIISQCLELYNLGELTISSSLPSEY